MMKAENREQFISVYNEEVGHVAMLWHSLPNEHNQELNDCIKKLKELVIIAADQAFGAPDKSR